jgi:hypothetical protein
MRATSTPSPTRHADVNMSLSPNLNVGANPSPN